MVSNQLKQINQHLIKSANFHRYCLFEKSDKKSNILLHLYYMNSF